MLILARDWCSFCIEYRCCMPSRSSRVPASNDASAGNALPASSSKCDEAKEQATSLSSYMQINPKPWQGLPANQLRTLHLWLITLRGRRYKSFTSFFLDEEQHFIGNCKGEMLYRKAGNVNTFTEGWIPSSVSCDGMKSNEMGWDRIGRDGMGWEELAVWNVRGNVRKSNAKRN